MESRSYNTFFATPWTIIPPKNLTKDYSLIHIPTGFQPIIFTITILFLYHQEHHNTTYWTDLFVRHFLFQTDYEVDRDDLLFFIRKIGGSNRQKTLVEVSISII